MPKISNLPAKKIVKILEKNGFEIDHQTGSHLILRQKEKPHRRITVPNHNPVSTGTIRAIIKQSGLTREEFLKRK